MVKQLKSPEEVKATIHKIANELTVEELIKIMQLPSLDDEQKKELAQIEKEQREVHNREEKAYEAELARRFEKVKRNEDIHPHKLLDDD
ncbi:DUF1679 domain-containing protein [Lentilactobacillus kisonensis]|uniref:DUF1679 domain-containing protein n=1 Tax=Lentilactobacillus kisonensis TaxID=481722 RepID=UPI0006D14B45|nr:DUF1679 domain-containing protein [Lentilactobacillus kisonensis]